MRSLGRTQTRTNNKANEIIEIDETTGPEWVTPEWDARGNMVYGPRPGDEATETKALLMVYDAWNRPVEFWEDTDESGDLDDPGDTQILECRYDGPGRRIQKTVKDDSDVTFDYYYSGRQVVEVRKGGSVNPYEQYVWGIRYVHSPVCRWYDENADGQDVETHYYTNDANFNVTALIATDGTPVERYVYDPYGQRTIWEPDWSDPVDWEDSKKNEILFTGHRLDDETGLYYGGWRYYHPTLGLWISRDLGEYVDGMSLYVYVSSSPLTRIDPFGLMEKFETPEKIRKQLGATIEDPSKAVRAGEISTSTSTLTVRVGEKVERGTAKEAQVEYHETVGMIATRFTPRGSGEASRFEVGPPGYIPPSWEQTEAEQSGRPYEGVSLPYYELEQFVTGWHNLAMMVEFAAYARMVKPEEQSPCCYAKLRWGHHGFQPYGGAHVAPPGKTPIPWQENLREMIRWMCKCEEEGTSDPYKYNYTTGLRGWLLDRELFTVKIHLKCLANKKVTVDTLTVEYWD